MNNDSNNTELNIHIGRLVLEGFSLTYDQQMQLKEAVETELNKMFLSNEISSAVSNAPQKIKTVPLQLKDKRPVPEQLGRQIAASIYNSLSGADGNNLRSEKQQPVNS